MELEYILNQRLASAITLLVVFNHYQVSLFVCQKSPLFNLHLMITVAHIFSELLPWTYEIAIRRNCLLGARFFAIGINVQDEPRFKLLQESPCAINDNVRTPCNGEASKEVVEFNGRVGKLKETRGNFNIMEREGIPMDSNAYARLLQVCINLKSLTDGKYVHAHIIKTGIKVDIFLGNRLIHMYMKSGCVGYARQVFDKMTIRNVFSWNAMVAGYAKCGSLDSARQLFDKMAERDEVSWNAMIAGYVSHGHGMEALKFFRQMQEAGMKATEFTFASTLAACASLSTSEQGKQVHANVIRAGFDSNVILNNAIVDMYAKCRSVESARKVFVKMTERDAVSWNAMIAGYVQNGHGENALRVFCQMQLAGVKPDHFTFASVLAACGNQPALEQGRQVLVHIIRASFDQNVFVASVLIDMYAKCGSLDDARLVFDTMSERDGILWNSMISGYARHGCGEEALKLFWKMHREGMKPTQFTFGSILSASSSLIALEQGKQVHAHVVRSGFGSHVFVGSGLVDMYAKCGCIEDAHQIFDRMLERDRVSWNSMIAGYAQNGCGKEAIQLFEQMLKAGMKPDHITFIGVLSACSHTGLVDAGHDYFDSMSRNHGITPRADHYACMVDMLGRAGRLTEAEDFMNNMPFEPDGFIWGPLLGACRIHGNMELGKRAAECLLELEPENAGHYVLLSHIYATAGRWDDVAKVRKKMKDEQVKKKPGCSWIELKSKVHVFTAQGRLHTQIEDIYVMLERLTGQMKDAGYVPDTNFMVQDLEEEY